MDVRYDGQSVAFFEARKAFSLPVFGLPSNLFTIPVLRTIGLSGVKGDLGLPDRARSRMLRLTSSDGITIFEERISVKLA